MSRAKAVLANVTAYCLNLVEDTEKDLDDVITYRGIPYKDQLIIPTDEAVTKDEVGKLLGRSRKFNMHVFLGAAHVSCYPSLLSTISYRIWVE